MGTRCTNAQIVLRRPFLELTCCAHRKGLSPNDLEHMTSPPVLLSLTGDLSLAEQAGGHSDSDRRLKFIKLWLA